MRQNQSRRLTEFLKRRKTNGYKGDKIAMRQEELEQIFLFRWAQMNSGKYPELNLLFHIPNGGLRSKTEAKRFKGAGVKAGVPDVFLPVASNMYHGLFIEMKSSNGRVSKEQEYWLNELSKEGYQTAVCRSWVDAAKEIIRYLDLPIEL